MCLDDDVVAGGDDDGGGSGQVVGGGETQRWGFNVSEREEVSEVVINMR